MAHLAADLAVTLHDDRPGMLAKAIGCVSAAGINIDGYSEMNGVVHVLTHDLPAARLYGSIRARLELAGKRLADADLQIAATALRHELELVTGNVRHFQRVPGLKVNAVLAEARASG